jgi:hypothetical protein
MAALNQQAAYCISSDLGMLYQSKLSLEQDSILSQENFEADE